MFVKVRRTMMMMVDLIIVNFSLYCAFLIRFDWTFPYQVLSEIIELSLWTSALRLFIFHMEGLYQWSFRYASLNEAIRILRAVTIGTLAMFTFMFVKQFWAMGRSVLFIDYFICLFLIFGFRFSFRIIDKIKIKAQPNFRRVLIVGAGDAGEMVARELLNMNNSQYRPIGFIDDDSRKRNMRIHGIRVFGKKEDIVRIVKEQRVEEIIIAIPSASGKEIRSIITCCEQADVKLKIVPGLQQILSGEVDIKEIRDVKPEDLLGRPSIQINGEEVRYFLQNKSVLVTGAGGSIGSEICRKIARFDPQVLLMYDHNENDVYFLEIELKKNFPKLLTHTIIGDIKDIGLLKHVFSTYQPSVVFHAAAHKHVPLMEQNPVAAVKNDIIGTRNLFYAAAHYHVDRFVMISTDKAVNPTSIMGASKRIAEMLLQAKAKSSRTKFMAVRFGNVIGSSGSVVQLFKKQIEARQSITVTHPEIRRFFMSVDEAAQLVIQAGAMGNGGEIFILDMGEPIKIVDLAKDLIILSGLEVNKDIAIEFIGLRPGEKLYEETLHDAEHDQATRHDRIFITQPNNFNIKKLRKDIKELEKLANLMVEDGIIKKIKEMVPSYSPIHRR